MPDLDFAFLADYARAKSGAIDSLSLGFDTIHVRALPVSHQTFVGLRIHLDRSDCESIHRIEIIVQSTDGDRMCEVLFNVEARWPDPEPMLGLVGVQAVIPILMPLSTAGRHSVELAIDGEHLKSIPFAVILSDPGMDGDA